MALPRQIVTNRLQHDGAAVQMGRGLELVQRQPDGAHNALVQMAVRVVQAQLTREGKAQVGDVVARAGAHKAVHVDADQRRGGEAVGGLFHDLAHAGVDGCFGRVQMTGRRIQTQSIRRAFFDQQKAAIALDDGRDCHIGFPAIGHGRHYPCPAPGTCQTNPSI